MRTYLGRSAGSSLCYTWPLGWQMGSGRWSEEVDLATLHSELTLCSRGTWIRATERMPQGPDLGTVKVRLRCMDSVRHAAGVQH